MFGFFKRKSINRAMVAAIYAALVERARDPILFTDFAVDDTFEGRFECLTAFAVLATRQLKSMPSPAPELAHDLIDHVFSQFDRALREAGVGDLTVPKRMKTLAAAFMGRASAYNQALQRQDSAPLADAILRNIYGSDPLKSDKARDLAPYLLAFDKALTHADFNQFADAIRTAPPISEIAKV